MKYVPVFPLALVLLASLASAQPATLIDLTLTNGPHEGHYQASSEDTTCSYGLAGEDDWGNQYSVATDDPDAFSSLQLIVPNSTQAAAGTGEFKTTVTFGAYFGDGTNYDIDTQNGKSDAGSGIVTVQDDGDTATVTLAGTTADGVGIEATITCNQVIRASGGSSQPDTTSSTPSGDISLTIGGSPYSFSTTSDDSSCSRDAYEDGDFYYSFYREDGSLELLLPDFAAAQAGSGAFYLSVDDQTYYLDTTQGNDDGSGVVSVQRQGDAYTLTLDVKTADGTAVTGTVTCAASE